MSLGVMAALSQKPVAGLANVIGVTARLGWIRSQGAQLPNAARIASHSAAVAVKATVDTTMATVASACSVP